MQALVLGREEALQVPVLQLLQRRGSQLACHVSRRQGGGHEGFGPSLRLVGSVRRSPTAEKSSLSLSSRAAAWLTC